MSITLDQLHSLMMENVHIYDGSYKPHEVSLLNANDITDGLAVFWTDEDGNDGYDEIRNVISVDHKGIIRVESLEQSVVEIEIFRPMTREEILG